MKGLSQSTQILLALLITIAVMQACVGRTPNSILGSDSALSSPSPTAGPDISPVPTATPAANDPFAVPSGAFKFNNIEQIPVKGDAGIPPGSTGWIKWHDTASTNYNDPMCPNMNVPLTLDTSSGFLARQFTLQHDAYYCDILYHTTLPNVASGNVSVSQQDFISARHFVYDTLIKVDSLAGVWVLEFGFEHRGWSGDLDSFMGVQCQFNGTPKVWWVADASTGGWRQTSVPCDPAQWADGNWHRLRLALSHNDQGTSTVHAFALDNNVYTGPWTGAPKHDAAGNPPVVVTKFQQGSAPNTQSGTQWLRNLTAAFW